jgi:hypothetical protein
MTMNAILSRAPLCASIPNSNLKLSGEAVAGGEGDCTAGAPTHGAAKLCISGAVLASLGTTAKYSAKSEQIDCETGEISGLEIPYSPMMARIGRFALQSVSRKFLPKFRTAVCLRWRQKGKDIAVWQSKEFKTASFAGLQTCGSVWACPVCAAKIAERRRAEIIVAMTAHKAAGGCVQLLTLTAPHNRSDKLVDLLAMQAKALKFFNEDCSVRAIRKEMGVIGQIRALEVTHGRQSASNNGWHPHYHILQFGGHGVAFSPFQLYEWADRLYDRWAACCVRAGLGEPSRLHGLKLDDGSKASAYVAKWGLEDEMTKGHTKKSAQGETPFDFLRNHLADSSDKQAGILFKEFAEAFKGKRQLHWSAGLKKRFAIGESSDEELSVMMDDYAELLGTITLEQWREVLRADVRGEVLQLASVGGWPAVSLFLESLLKAKNEQLPAFDIE